MVQFISMEFKFLFRCLYELGILSEESQVAMDQSVSTTSEPVKVKPFKLKASIPDFVEKTDGKKSYTCYQIKVTCQHQMGPEEQFFVERRYSDFHNFDLALKAKVTIMYIPEYKSGCLLGHKLCTVYLNVKSNAGKTATIQLDITKPLVTK